MTRFLLSFISLLSIIVLTRATIEGSYALRVTSTVQTGCPVFPGSIGRGVEPTTSLDRSMCIFDYGNDAYYATDCNTFYYGLLFTMPDQLVSFSGNWNFVIANNAITKLSVRVVGTIICTYDLSVTTKTYAGVSIPSPRFTIPDGRPQIYRTSSYRISADTCRPSADLNIPVMWCLSSHRGGVYDFNPCHSGVGSKSDMQWSGQRFLLSYWSDLKYNGGIVTEASLISAGCTYTYTFQRVDPVTQPIIVTGTYKYDSISFSKNNDRTGGQDLPSTNTQCSSNLVTFSENILFPFQASYTCIYQTGPNSWDVSDCIETVSGSFSWNGVNYEGAFQGQAAILVLNNAGEVTGIRGLYAGLRCYFVFNFKPVIKKTPTPVVANGRYIISGAEPGDSSCPTGFTNGVIMCLFANPGTASLVLTDCSTDSYVYNWNGLRFENFADIYTYLTLGTTADTYEIRTVYGGCDKKATLTRETEAPPPEMSTGRYSLSAFKTSEVCSQDVLVAASFAIFEWSDQEYYVANWGSTPTNNPWHITLTWTSSIWVGNDGNNLWQFNHDGDQFTGVSIVDATTGCVSSATLTRSTVAADNVVPMYVPGEYSIEDIIEGSSSIDCSGSGSDEGYYDEICVAEHGVAHFGVYSCSDHTEEISDAYWDGMKFVGTSGEYRMVFKRNYDSRDADQDPDDYDYSFSQIDITHSYISTPCTFSLEVEGSSTGVVIQLLSVLVALLAFLSF